MFYFRQTKKRLGYRIDTNVVSADSTDLEGGAMAVSRVYRTLHVRGSIITSDNKCISSREMTGVIKSARTVVEGSCKVPTWTDRQTDSGVWQKGVRPRDMASARVIAPKKELIF